MMEEKRSNPFCNIYDLHCKGQFDEIKSDIKDIKKALLGNGDNKNSLLVQTALNTSHRMWMESWGRMIMSGLTLASITFIGTLIWMVSTYVK